nr:DegT/DnrJ/EryC1/StrS aminotransferase family protein [Rubrobacteraceae bacterium]
KQDISVRRPVDPLLHHELGLDPTGYPVAENLFARTISLPLYPNLTEGEVQRVAEVLLEVLDREANR